MGWYSASSGRPEYLKEIDAFLLLGSELDKRRFCMAGMLDAGGLNGS